MIYLSFSSYDSYKKCPLKFYYEKNYPLKANYAEMEIGKFMHRYFYRLLMNGKMEITPEDAWKNIKKGRRIIYNFEPEAETIEELSEEYKSLGNHIILRRSEEEYIRRIEEEIENSEYMVNEIKYNPKEFEKHISEKYGEVIFHGYIDILFENLIGELKTGFENERDKEQLKFYSLLLYLRDYKIEDGFVIYLLNKDIKNYEFKIGEIEKLLDDAIHVAKNIENGYFKGKKSEICNYCPYRDFCEVDS